MICSFQAIVCIFGGCLMLLAFFVGALIGGAVGFPIGLGAVSNTILKKTSLV